MMKMNLSLIKTLLQQMRYMPIDKKNNFYGKTYSKHDNYKIFVDLDKKKIIYKDDSMPHNQQITIDDLSTSNFSHDENFVVLECVDRLLEKGYKPCKIILERKFPLGKGRADIMIVDNNNKPFLIIECKTWGGEFIKEKNKMLKNGGKLFSYYVQEKYTKFLCLYTSTLTNGKIYYQNEIVKIGHGWEHLSNQKETYEHWNKNFKDNGIFDAWAHIYKVESKALIRSKLEPITQDSSGKIFNQFAEILRHNVVSDKPNAFNKMLNLFICKIIDEDKNDEEQVEFQWLDDDTDESLQTRLNDLYKKGMHKFLNINVTDFTDCEITTLLSNIDDQVAQHSIRDMFLKLRLQKNPEFAFIEVYNEETFKSNAKIVREIVELLQPYQFRYGHKQQFLGDFFEKLLNTSMKQEAGQFFTPTPIARFIVSSLPIKEFICNKISANDDDILPAVIDFACGTGHFLTEYMDTVQTIIENIDTNIARRDSRRKLNYWRSEEGKYAWADKYVYGIDADYRLVKSAKVSSFLNGDGEANIIRANGLDNFKKSIEYKGKLKTSVGNDGRDNAEFDILIANPPYSVGSFKSTINHGEESFELFEKITDSSSEIECLFVERMKQLVSIGGYAGIVLPNSILSNVGIYVYTREMLLKFFNIIAITELGTNTFMATGTNTIILFLQRRHDRDYIRIKNAINDFFDVPKDVTVLGIENAFSTYVFHVFDGISLEDYIAFVNKNISESFASLPILNDYINWFSSLSETQKIKKSKYFQTLSLAEQSNKLQQLFYDKVFNIEKEKMLYFFLTYTQKTTIVRVGEKEAEKEFLGYEFSNRRGHEGLKMLPTGTKLYSDGFYRDPEKANYYIYNAYINNSVAISPSMINNIFYVDTFRLLEYNDIPFNKKIQLNINLQLRFNTIYPVDKLSKKVDIIKGVSYSKNEQVYDETDKIVLTADNITLDNRLNIVKKIYLKSDFEMDLRTRLLFDDIFICLSSGSRSHIGKLAYIHCNTNYHAGGFMGIIRKKNGLSEHDDVDMKYIFEVLSMKDTRDYIGGISNGANIKNLNDSINSIKIPFPPLPIQKQIVNDIRPLEIAESDNINTLSSKRALLHSPAYFAYATERIEKIKIMTCRGKSTEYGTSAIQIIKSGQARGYENFDFTNRYYVSEKFVSDERNLKKGDILINSTGVGTAGRVTLFNLEGDYVADSHITIVRLDKDKAVPKYILYALANIGFENIEKMATGQSGQIELSVSTINNIRVPLPSIEIQKQIVKEIEVIEQDIIKLENSNSSLRIQRGDILRKYLCE